MQMGAGSAGSVRPAPRRQSNPNGCEALRTSPPVAAHAVGKLVAVLVAVIALVGAAVAIAVSDATAQTSDAAGSGASSGMGSEAGTDPEVAVIMDASSSMLIEDVDGGSRLDAAKQAGVAFVEALPDDSRVGMLAYGSVEDDSPDNREAGCADIRTLAPVDVLDAGLLVDEIDALDARGYTPIGDALYAAADEFTGEGERTIVLVSDGEDTCAPPPPCEVAGELAEQGVDVTIHTVGFLVGDEAREQLECIAAAAGGEYRDAADADELAASMEFLSRRALESYGADGTAFEFAAEPEDALYLGRGLYRTTVSDLPTGEMDVPHYFRVAVPDDHLAFVSATPIIDRDRESEGGEGRSVNMRISADNESAQCEAGGRLEGGSDAIFGVSGTWGAPGGVVTQFGADEDEACDREGWLVNVEPMLEQQQRHEGPVEVGIEVSVQFEPLPDDAELESYPEGGSGSAGNTGPAEGEQPQPIEPGPGFVGATELGSGMYEARIVPGEAHYFRIPVEWGQRPVATLRSDDLGAEEDDRLRLEMFNPMRKPLGSEDVTAREASEVTVSAERPVNYRNRQVNVAGLDTAMAGDHYVAVSMAMGFLAEAGVDRDYQLSVAVEGAPASGPEWRPTAEPGPEPSVEPIVFVDDDDATGGGGDRDDAGEDRSDLADAESDGMSTGGVLALVGVGLLIVVGASGLWLLLLRKRR